MTVIDAHSHLWQGRAMAAQRKTAVQELPRDPLDLAADLERLGVAKVATFTQEMTRVRGQWLGSNQLAVALQRHWPAVVLGVCGAEPLDEQDKLNSVRRQEVEAALT